ncbi:hypothetical protein Z043_120022, partial [Scleropages formosus]
ALCVPSQKWTAKLSGSNHPHPTPCSHTACSLLYKQPPQTARHRHPSEPLRRPRSNPASAALAESSPRPSSVRLRSQHLRPSRAARRSLRSSLRSRDVCGAALEMFAPHAASIRRVTRWIWHSPSVMFDGIMILTVLTVLILPTSAVEGSDQETVRNDDRTCEGFPETSPYLQVLLNSMMTQCMSSNLVELQPGPVLWVLEPLGKNQSSNTYDFYL